MALFQSLWTSLRRPVSSQKKALLTERWNELPRELQTPWQVVGRQLAHCGYTLGPSYCSFGCTHCYLPANANRVPLPSLESMKEQIDANRNFLGEAGALQITGGDVVDAYVRAGRPGELVEVLRYANEVGTVPMLMTHGQRLLDDPDLFARLVLEGDLRKLSVHIDITQAGRPGFPRRTLRNEADLHALREQFVRLVQQIRCQTGKSLAVAHTVTVTEQNLGSLGEILRWLIEDKERLDVFGMISFQPEADVGRTRFSGEPATPQACWQAIESALGRELSRDQFWFGDPACSHQITLAVLYPERRVVPLFTGDEEGQRFIGELLATFSGVGSRGVSNSEANLRRLALLARRPRLLATALRYARHVLDKEDLRATSTLRRWLGGRIGFLNIVQHNFMSAEELRSSTPAIERRLQACSFRGAVRRGDGWEAVPMCAMNIDERQDLYASQTERRTASEDAASKL